MCAISGRHNGDHELDQRYYAVGMGRFNVPDPSTGVRATNPATWNKYAYVIGDPINFSDRRGLFYSNNPDPDEPETEEPPPFYPEPTPPPPPPSPEPPPPVEPGGGPTFGDTWRLQALGAILNLSKGCQDALGQKWNLYNGADSLAYKVNGNNPNADSFFDGRTDAVKNSYLSSWGWTDPDAKTTTVGSYLSNPGYAALVSVNDGHAGNQVVLGEQFFGLNAQAQGVILVHEVLHTYTGLNDTDLAEKLGLGANLNIAAASLAVSNYLSFGCVGVM
jgi:RHS repeat-associated protein